MYKKLTINPRKTRLVTKPEKKSESRKDNKLREKQDKKRETIRKEKETEDMTGEKMRELATQVGQSIDNIKRHVETATIEQQKQLRDTERNKTFQRIAYDDNVIVANTDDYVVYYH